MRTSCHAAQSETAGSGADEWVQLVTAAREPERLHSQGNLLSGLYRRGCIIHRSLATTSKVTGSVRHSQGAAIRNGQDR